jgi:hypothetical protein
MLAWRPLKFTWLRKSQSALNDHGRKNSVTAERHNAQCLAQIQYGVRAKVKSGARDSCLRPQTKDIQTPSRAWRRRNLGL